MKHDVFISYTTHDKPTADAVCHALEAQGVRCWIAPRDIPLGQNYAETLINAINAAKLMVLVFSAKTNASRHVRNEVERAFNRDVPVIPFRIEDAQATGALEYFLSLPHWLDAFTPPLQSHLNSLVESVRALLMARTGTQTSAPGTIAGTPAATLPHADPDHGDKAPALEDDTRCAAGTRHQARRGLWRMRLGAAAVTVILAGVALTYLYVRHTPSNPQNSTLAVASAVHQSPPNPAPLPPAEAQPRPLPPPVQPKTPPDAAASPRWPEPDSQFPTLAPDRKAAIAALDEATGVFKASAGDDQSRLMTARGFNYLARAYWDIGEHEAAITQARKAVSLTDIPSGDWFRNGGKITELSNAAIILWRGGKKDEARAAADTAHRVWASSLSMTDNAMIYGTYGGSLVSAFLAQGNSQLALATYGDLDRLRTSQKLSWDSAGAQPVLGRFVAIPMRIVARNGMADEAFDLAQSLKDPTARLYALLDLLSQLSIVNRCDLTQKVGEAAVSTEASIAGADTVAERFLIPLADGASECANKPITLAAIGRASGDIHGGNAQRYDFSQLAYFAARVGDRGKVESLIRDGNKASAEGGEGGVARPSDGACIENSAGRGEFKVRSNLIKAYGALRDYDRASVVAEEMLDNVRQMKAPAVRLRCLAFAAESLMDAKMWKVATRVSLEAFQAMQQTGKIANVNQDWPRRIAIVLGESGKFEEANAALAFLSGPQAGSQGVRHQLAVLAARMDNRATADKFAAAIGPGEMQYAFAKADIARVLAGVQD